MKKVLLVAPLGGVVGGISRWTGHIYEYYHSHACNDCSLHFLSTGRKQFVSTNMSFFKKAYLGIKEYPDILLAFRKKLSAQKYDVIHLTTSGGLSFIKDPLFLLMAKIVNSKTVVHIHFGRIPELVKAKDWEYRMMMRTLKLASCIVAIDKATYIALVGLGFSNVELLPNPLSPEVPELITQNKGVERVPRSILFIGHLLRTKGVFELLEACSSMENIKLKLVGRATPEIIQEINTLYPGPNQFFEVVGELPYEEVIAEMRASDIFVLPTYTEGFPNVILEAMAAGCAIVSTPVGAIPEMLEPESDGAPVATLVPVKDVVALRSAIVELLDNTELKDSMRKVVASRVQLRYSLPSVWDNLIQIWKTL